MNNDRVVYKNSPLIEVVFQLRFPTILSINAEQPVKFQEMCREQFPFYEEGIEQQNEFFITPDIGKAQFRTSKNKNYSFVSADNAYKINLTSTFIAISTLNYSCWEDFKSKIEYVVSIFEDVYKPSFYIRMGLRYINLIDKSSLNISEKKWKDLIKPHVLGIATDFEDGINTYLSEAEFKTSEDKVTTKVHFEFVHANGKEETSFLIDCDYFINENVDKSEMLELSEKLHMHSSNFLRSSITEELHAAMQPEKIL